MCERGGYTGGGGRTVHRDSIEVVGFGCWVCCALILYWKRNIQQAVVVVVAAVVAVVATAAAARCLPPPPAHHDHDLLPCLRSVATPQQYTFWFCWAARCWLISESPFWRELSSLWRSSKSAIAPPAPLVRLALTIPLSPLVPNNPPNEDSCQREPQELLSDNTLGIHLKK